MPSIDQLMRVLDSSPEDDFVLYALAMEHAKLGKHEAAVGYFDRAIAADPANPYHYYHKAKSLASLGRTTELRDTLQTGIAQARAAQDTKAVSELSDLLEGAR
jgi:tetratricopeptide (TPR) repeat protein